MFEKHHGKPSRLAAAAHVDRQTLRLVVLVAPPGQPKDNLANPMRGLVPDLSKPVHYVPQRKSTRRISSSSWLAGLADGLAPPETGITAEARHRQPTDVYGDEKSNTPRIYT